MARKASFIKRFVRKAARVAGIQTRKPPSTKASGAMNAERRVELDEMTFVQDGEGFSLVDGTNVKGSVIVPEKVAGLPVTVVRKRAFARNTAIVEITLPDTVKTLGSSAFEGCINLRRAILPIYLEVINAKTFAGCANLEQAELPARLRRVCSEAFRDCSKLRDLSHRVLGGVSSTAFITKWRESHLPVSLRYIGNAAFLNCSSLERVSIPYMVVKIPEDAYRGCSSLREVTFHTNLRSIESGAFAGCASLTSVRLPESIETIIDGAFESGCKLVCEQNAEVLRFSKKNGNPVDLCEADRKINCASLFIPKSDTDDDRTPFYRAEDLDLAQKLYQVRTPVDIAVHFDTPGDAQPSRYQLLDGVYHARERRKEDTASILFVGDLMCRSSQQDYAFRDGFYNFDKSFDAVRAILQSSDLSIGNMEALVSKSIVYSSEACYVEDRSHLNAPQAYLVSVRNAGFDVVTNAQNHVYDAGVLGIYETLDALNQNELMHIGVYANDSDARYLIFEVNGITIGLVAYLDQARQKMKQANLSNKGLSDLVSTFDSERIKDDIDAARSAGAEFVIAYCHWGVEYKRSISKRQEMLARMVVDAGADYIIGSHSHCPQPRTVFKSPDGRLVPCVYSGGNFVSDIDIELPVTRDTFIGKLKLARNAEGIVAIASESYIPCRVVLCDDHPGSVQVRPCYMMLESDNIEERYEAEEALVRIANTMGSTYHSETPALMGEIASARMPEPSEQIITRSARARISIDDQPSDHTAGRFIKKEDGCYVLSEDTSVNEVRIACLGRIEYSAELERQVKYGDSFLFDASWRQTKDCVAKDDLVIGQLPCVCSEAFPTSGIASDADYRNCRKEFLHAVRYGGVDCLAAASFHSFDAGIQGVLDTAVAATSEDLAIAGISHTPAALFEANGIKLAVLSYASDCAGYRNAITNEAGSGLVSLFSEEQVKNDVTLLRSKGVEFVVVYLDCMLDGKPARLSTRKRWAEQVANLGVDYVICTVEDELSDYGRYETSDGRVVPIVTSLGTYLGACDDDSRLSAVLRLSVRKDERGSVYVTDHFVPMKRFASYEGAPFVTAAASKFFNKQYRLADFKSVEHGVQEAFGSVIKPDASRHVRVGYNNQNQLTLQQIISLSGAELSASDSKILEKGLAKHVKRIVTRKQDLSKGCVAVITPNIPERRFTADFAKSKGALLVIGQEKDRSQNVPYLAVGDPQKVFMKLMSAIRDKYHPIVVGITGTMGKSTTKELAYAAFSQHYRTLCVEGNNNTVNTSSIVMQKLTDKDEAYVQEMHGGSKGSCSTISNIIRPNIGIITAIGKGHLSQMGSIENIVKEKMSITAGMPEDGLLVLNDDNEWLHNQRPDCRVVRCSAYNAECDYYAEDIVEGDTSIDFSICCSEGKYRAHLRMPGIHNVNNALAVFAAGREAGIPPYEIIAGMARFSFSDSQHASNRVRQNMISYGGYGFFIDTYNTGPGPVASSADTLMRMPVKSEGKHIAILGDMLEQGEDTNRIHFDTGVLLADKGVDLALCFGEVSKYFVEGMRSRGKEAYFFNHRQTFNEAIAALVRPGDAMLVKGAHALQLYEKTIVPVFGDIARMD